MSDNSKIEWTDATWNPVRGCSKVSPGCVHCYAETFAERFRGVPGHPFEFGFDLRLVPEKLGDPIRWSKPKKIFVNSMSDLFHEDVPDEYIEKVCRVMLAANWHTYQILTKRADRMAALLQGKLRKAAKAAHIWWGVSVENRQHGLPRIAKLRNAKPAVAFLSIEPLLEDLGKFDLCGIQWVIVGGESGPGARPMLREWVRDIRDLCGKADVPFFFKQWGGVRKKQAGRRLDGKTYDEFPDHSLAAAPSSSQLLELREEFELPEPMPAANFYNKPFDEGTLTKLQIFELYAREWLPVFLSPERPPRPEIHLFDFFAGPGTDSAGEFGSPMRLLRQLKEYQGMAGWTHVRVHVHFSDASPTKIKQLEANIDSHQLRLPRVSLDIQPLKFEAAIQRCAATLANQQAAKLIFIDQFGVDHVTPEVFRQLVNSPTCDFLFFLSSSTLHRFRDHPAIKQKITRPDDHYQVHQAALDYYRGFLPNTADYFLAPFSIKKGSNIYGLIFGSAHPLGMDKFLQVAWKKDEINGEADFDINRDNIAPGELLLALDEFRPSKITAFDRELEQLLRDGRLKNELDVVHICFNHGVKRQQAESVLAKLKKERVIEADFRVPQIDRSKLPRPIKMLN